MKIFLIRHGQTDWNLQKKIQGSTDIPLNENGINEAQKRAEYFSNENIIPNKIYCSNKLRAIKTAEIIGEKFNLTPVITDDLEEINLGIFEGMSFKEVEIKYPNEAKEWDKDSKNSLVHGGENYSIVANRAINKLKKICEVEKDKDKIFIVTHGVVIMTIRLFLQDKNWTEKNFNLIPENLGFVTIDGNEILEY